MNGFLLTSAINVNEAFLGITCEIAVVCVSVLIATDTDHAHRFAVAFELHFFGLLKNEILVHT